MFNTRALFSVAAVGCCIAVGSEVHSELTASEIPQPAVAAAPPATRPAAVPEMPPLGIEMHWRKVSEVREVAPAPMPTDPMAAAPAAPASAVAPAATAVTVVEPTPFSIAPRYTVRRDFGNGVGYASGYTYLEGFVPLWQTPGQSLIFGNARVINYDNAKYWETQIGGGARKLVDETVWGVNGFYDGRNSNVHYYHQLGFGLEALRQKWEYRANFYFPVGQQRFLANDGGFSNPQFVGQNIALDHLRTYETALRGFNLEAGRILPSCHCNVRTYAYLGYYHYDNTGVLSMDGIRGRLESWIGENVSMNFAAQHDRVTGSTITGGVSFHLGGVPRGFRQTNELAAKLGNRVVRDPNIVLQQSNTTTRELAIDPVTGQPTQVRHVESYAGPGGDGSVEHPYQTLGQLQAGSGPNMILFAHGGSVFNNQNIVLQPSQRFLGEGIDHLFTAVQGTFLLPRATMNNALPQILNSAGNAITLGDRDEVSGFVINGASNAGILGNGLTAFDINRNVINGSGANGIDLQGVNGTGRIVGNISNGNAYGAPIGGVPAGGSGISISGTAFAGEIANNTADNNAGGPQAVGNGINVAVTTVNANIVGNNTTGNATGGGSVGSGINVAATTFNGSIANNNASQNANNSGGIGNGINVTVGTLNGSVTGNTANDNASGMFGTGNGINVAAGTLNGDVSGNTANNNATANGLGFGPFVLFRSIGNGVNVQTGTLNGNVANNTASGNATGSFGIGSGINVGAATITGTVNNNAANNNAAGANGTGNGVTIVATTFNGAVSGNTANGNANNVGTSGQGIALAVGGAGRSILDMNSNSVSGNTGNNNAQVSVNQSGTGVLGINFAGNTSTSLGAVPTVYDFRNLGGGTFQVDVGTNTGSVGSSTGGVTFAPPGTAFP